MHVLVLDGRRRPQDHPVHVLIQRGHLVARAKDPDAAFAQLTSATPPDVLLVDVSALGAPALDLIRRVRSEIARPAAYIIAMLDREEEEELLGPALKAGIDDYVVKPMPDEGLELRLQLAQRVRGFGNDALSSHGRLHFMATHDALTHVWNRASIAGHLYRAMARAVRDGTSLAVIMCDVDHFKEVNDTRGHVVGDQVLRGVAQRLRAVVRPLDVVGRYGGEEFIILVPGCTPALAVDVAERARAAIAQTPIQTSAGPMAVTVSLGVANLTEVMSQGPEGPQALVEATDSAMYAAKAAGRNRVVVWRPPAVAHTPAV